MYYFDEFTDISFLIYEFEDENNHNIIHVYPQGEENTILHGREQQGTEENLVNNEYVIVIIIGYESEKIPNDIVKLFIDNKFRKRCKMIYITGDCHGDYTRFNRINFPQQKQLTKEDYVIICGDFGFWEDTKEQEYWMKWLDEKSFTTLWIDGNHENFDLLSKYEVSQWHGGLVQKIKPSVIHLMRGQVYEIEGKKLFTFGGAKSHDMSGGILNLDHPEDVRRKKLLDKRHILYRVNHLSWWKEELPNQEEYEEGRKNLEKHNWNVDYIITHCCASSTQTTYFSEEYIVDELTEYLEEIKERCIFKKWFFGHYHRIESVTEKEMVLYEKIHVQHE